MPRAYFMNLKRAKPKIPERSNRVVFMCENRCAC
jgi:hypothetical protein